MSVHLARAGVETRYLFSGRPRDRYFDMQPFGDWWDRRGLSFVTSRGRLRPFQTLMQNSVRELYRDIVKLDLSDFDLVISDFEPISAWAARRQGVPCITIGHQYAFEYAIPIEGDSLVSRAIMKFFAPGAERLGLHWHHFEQPILPPIIDTRERALPIRDGQVLVYLGFESPAEVIPLLQRFPRQKFVYYGDFGKPLEDRNVSLRPLSVQGFKQDIAQSRGVICNAGFELASEALYLGKSLLVKPLQGQMEQLSNALALERLGLGQRMQTLNEEAISRWLDTAPVPECHYPDVAEAIVNWLLKPQRPTVQQLADSLWQSARVSSHGNGPMDTALALAI